MAIEVRQVDYHYVLLGDEPAAAAAALSTLLELGIGILGFSQFPHSHGRSQVDLIARDGAALAKAVLGMGLSVSREKSGFLIQGDDEPGAAVAHILERLGNAHVKVVSMQAVCAGAGRFGALLWVAPADIEIAATALDAVESIHDIVDETSEESFPASDPPAWAMAGPE